MSEEEKDNPTDQNGGKKEERGEGKAHGGLPAPGNANFIPAEVDENLPEELTILPLGHRPLFPGMMMPIAVTGQELIDVVQHIVKDENRLMGAAFARELNEDNVFESELYPVGVVFRIHKLARVADDTVQVMIQVLHRAERVRELPLEEGEVGVRWRVKYHQNPTGQMISEEVKAYIMAIISSVKELLQLNPLFQEQLKILMNQLSHEEPGKIMDLIASMTSADSHKLQGVLETYPIVQRAEKLLVLLKEEIELSRLQEKIKKNIEEKISKQQKEFFLREQLKEIKKELGLEKDEKTSEIEKFQERLEKLELPADTKKVIEDEIAKIRLLEPGSAEYGVSRTYLDWLTVLPWGFFSEDNFDVPRARRILDEDHYGLQDVKERILEFISTGRKRGKLSGSILLFVGPPGVGKTSIGHSIARALGRKFYRFSLGGMRDEAEIKGHRRTYIGAMPGKLIQALKTVGTANPVIMLDELDKIGASFQGDPASALLEVLDPAQNAEFLDHYLDVRFDLSNILFISTANQLDTIPPALLDRMEVIKLSGYIMQEKIQIAQRYLIPRLLETHGLKKEEAQIPDATIEAVVERYAREAGVRSLEKNLGKIMRKVNLNQAEAGTREEKSDRAENKPGEGSPLTIEPEQLQDYLGQPQFPEEILYQREIPGVALGLAWTSLGGATLYVEAAGLRSKSGSYKQTGQLGNVMQESSEIAYSFIRSRSGEFRLDSRYFDEHFVHLHVPAGATPKDGPSAGITMALALYSLVARKPLPRNLAMTGELTLTGKVLPVGGIREKTIAARRVGVTRLILPAENEKDFVELPEHIKEGLTVNYADYFEDVLKFAWPPGGPNIPTPPG